MSAEPFGHGLIIALKKRLNFVLESEEFKMKEWEVCSATALTV